MSSMKISELSNLGEKSEEMLNSIEIYTKEDISKIGSVEIYKRLKIAGYQISLNMLWALVGVEMGISWKEIPAEIKEELKKQI